MREEPQTGPESPQQRYEQAREQRRGKLRGPQPAEDAPSVAVTLDDFYAYMPQHAYMYTPARELWPASSVNSRIPPIPLLRDGKPKLNKEGEPMVQAANAWLDRNKPVEQMTWAPGLPMIVRDRLVSAGGWIEHRGVSCFNLYKPPMLALGDADEAEPWLAHIHQLYPKAVAHHIIRWLAHRVQRPQEKINHALMLGGKPGIGKDTMLEPVKRAVGPWNFSEVTPQHLFGRFNGFVKSVILRVSEARDLGDVNRFAFYEHMKMYTAAPPDVLRVDEKNLREYSVLNCCGVILTTNHKSDGIYLPADDRRHFAAWSDAKKEDFADDYWTARWGWYEDGGYAHVAAYLASLDISDFDPKAPPPKTAAFWEIVHASRAPEDAELADVLDALGKPDPDNPGAVILPDAVTLQQVQQAAAGDFETWIRDRRNRRQIPFRFEKCGYVPVRNEAAESGLWVINGARQVIYAKASLSLREQLIAARKLMDDASAKQSKQ
jgi:Family of unknown function (DUF5906)